MKKRMNFRQRLAWTIVIIYVMITVFVLYYIIDYSDSYAAFAVEHIEQYHNNEVGKKSVQNQYTKFYDWQISLWSLLYHLSDIPLLLWIFILVLPYLQVFCMLLACTRLEPRHSIAFMWPCVIYSVIVKVFDAKVFSKLSSKAVNSYSIENGHAVINT